MDDSQDPEVVLYGKRKKKKNKHPNPLFEQWLTEWRDEAAEKGWKSQYNYNKALATLKSFPLPLASGKECKMLKNFGDKTCKLLDVKLAEHVALYGTTAPVSDTSTSSTSTASISSSTVTSTNQIPSSSVISSTTNQNRSGGDASTSSASTIDVTLDDSDSEDTVKQPAKKRRKSSGNKEYVPAYRSGPYAILLALYRDRQDANCQGYLTKKELMQQAQPHCDASFTQLDPNTAQYYTAWSSMATLLKKGLVDKELNPAQFSLTESGCNLAHRLEYVHDNSTFNNTPAVARQPDILPPLPVSVPSSSSSVAETESITALQPFIATDTDNNRLRFWYISEDNQQVREKDKASVTIDDDFGLGFLVKVSYQKLIMSGKNYSLDLTRPLKEEVYAYLADKDAEEVAIPDAVINKHVTKQHTATKNVSATLSSSLTGVKKTKPSSTRDTVSSTTTDSITSTSRGTAPVVNSNNITHSSHHISMTTSLDVRVPTSTNSRPVYSAATTATSRVTVPNIDSNFKSSVGLSVHSAATATSRVTVPDVDCNSQSSVGSTTSSVPSLPVPEFVLRPGQFEVVLCIDNREFYGSSKSNTKILLPDLMKNNVNCDLRELHVGDLVWIAREKLANLPGQLVRREAKELVLDFIVERKRMDDLVGSMVDGRLQDQKFRLKRCGVKNAIFLIENYGSMQNFSLGEDRIKQAITNTQVIDGFTVKRVRDTKESVVYLTVMTRYLQNYYNNKTLHACSPDVVKELKKPFDIHDTECYLMPFNNFNLGSVKSKALTTSEMFGKQLIQLHGMSADKAKGVIDTYSTLPRLLAAYDRCNTNKDKESLLSGIKCGRLTRNLGIAQSKQIAALYCTETPLT